MRMAEMNQRVAGNLQRIITALQSGDDPCSCRCLAAAMIGAVFHQPASRPGGPR
jgi:hypothetical protein